MHVNIEEIGGGMERSQGKKRGKELIRRSIIMLQGLSETLSLSSQGRRWTGNVHTTLLIFYSWKYTGYVVVCVSTVFKGYETACCESNP